MEEGKCNDQPCSIRKRRMRYIHRPERLLIKVSAQRIVMLAGLLTAVPTRHHNGCAGAICNKNNNYIHHLVPLLFRAPGLDPKVKAVAQPSWTRTNDRALEVTQAPKTLL